MKGIKTIRQLLIERDGSNCRQCGEELMEEGPVKPTIDHIRPRVKGGVSRLDNYQLLCPPCNQTKSDFWDGVSGVGLVGNRMPKMIKGFQVTPGGRLVDKWGFALGN